MALQFTTDKHISKLSKNKDRKQTCALLFRCQSLLYLFCAVMLPFELKDLSLSLHHSVILYDYLQGLYLEITGPTQKDLKLRAHLDYEEVSRAMSGRSIGFFIGAAIGGFLVDKLDPYCDLMVAVCLDLGATATIVAPHAQEIGLLWFLFVMQGTFEGIINIGKIRFPFNTSS